MSSSFRIFDIAGSALAAESVRLNTVASNLANVDSVTGDPNTVYKAHVPVFASAPELAGAQTPGVSGGYPKAMPRQRNVTNRGIPWRMRTATSTRPT